jgi:hypothetical protein
VSTSGCGWLRTAVRVGLPKLGPIQSGMTDEHGDDQNLRYFDLGEFIPAAWHNQQFGSVRTVPIACRKPT